MEKLPLTIGESVKQFHQKYGHLVSDKVNVEVPSEVRTLRKKLIDEEYDELMLGLDSNDMVEIADGAADLIYVIVGTCISYGIDIDRIFAEVHRSNMTKTPVIATNGAKYGTKTPKGPDFIAPAVEMILFAPTVRTELEANNN